MTRKSPQSSRLTALAALVLCAGFTYPAQAQTSLGFDPYRPYNSGYESYSMPPTAAENFSAINQTRTRSYSSRANEMSIFYDELYGPPPGIDGKSDTPPRLVGPGVSYNRANRQFDERYGRVYRPNSNDAEFYKDQQKRTQDYFEALKESDPKKRAEKLRLVELENLRAARSLAERPRSPSRTPRASRTLSAPSAGSARARAPQGTGTSEPRNTQPGLPATLPRSPFAPPPASIPPGRVPNTLPNATRSATPAPGILGPSRTPAPSYRPGIEKPSEILERALRSDPPATDQPADDPLAPRSRRPNPPQR